MAGLDLGPRQDHAARPPENRGGAPRHPRAARRQKRAALRSFSWADARSLDKVAAELLKRAWAAVAGPGNGPLTIDVGSSICRAYGPKKEGVTFGYTKVRGLLAPPRTKLAPAGHRKLVARLRHALLCTHSARGAGRTWIQAKLRSVNGKDREGSSYCSAIRGLPRAGHAPHAGRLLGTRGPQRERAAFPSVARLSRPPRAVACVW